MVSHWGASGQPDGYMEKLPALALLPALQLGIFLLLTFLPKLLPLKKNFSKFSGQFGWLVFAIVAFFAYVHAITIMWNLGFAFGMMQALSPAFAALFYCIGWIMRQSKRNWMVGIRTPWTLSDDVVWGKTHAIAGKLFKACGGIALLGLAFPDEAIWLIIAPVIASSLFCVAYSYYIFAKKK